MFVVEIVAPRAQAGALYATGGGEVFVRTDPSKKKLTIEEIQDEIRRRQADNQSRRAASEPDPLNVATTETFKAPWEFRFSLTHDGTILDGDEELLAAIAEAAYAANSGHPVTPNPGFQVIDQLQAAIKEIDPGSATPSDRYRRIDLLRLKDNYQARLQALRHALSLGFQKQVLDFLGSPEDLRSTVKGLVQEFLPSGGYRTSHGRHSFDLFRTHPPKLHAIIVLSEAEAQAMLEMHDIGNLMIFTGSGWDLFDLPWDVRIGKVVYAEMQPEKYGSFERSDAMNFYSWSVGLR